MRWLHFARASPIIATLAIVMMAATNFAFIAGTAYALVKFDIIKKNVTPSVPPGIWFWVPGPIGKGDVVAFHVPASMHAWMKKYPNVQEWADRGGSFLKPVVSVPGETICRHGETALIDSVAVYSPSNDKNGVSLPVWHGCRILQEDEFAVLSTTLPDSIDSRVYGPVKAGDIIGKYRLLIAF